MADKIAASIAFVIVLVYLGSYAFLLHAIPLWFIIGGILAAIAVEYYESMKGARTDENGAE